MPKVTLVGRFIGVHAPVIGRYERDDVKPSIEIAFKIAKALEVSLDYLVGDSNTVLLDKDITKRIEAIVNMDSEDKNTVLKIIDKMLTNKKFKDFFDKNMASL